ncbi:MAG TPA: M48 family metalloprotease [Pyrinomonadaceae bacterium]
MSKICLGLAVAVLLFIPNASNGQDCVPQKVTFRTQPYNIFSPEQEMVLGELTYQRLAREMHFVREPELIARLNRIGERLIKHLPDTGLKFQFFIVDIPEANAFDVPGGYILFSRKLIGFVNSEDELAGVMAHELGHAVVRHGASDFSDLLKKILNVTQVGDRKDIAQKYNLLIERQRTKRVSPRSESEQQLEADRIGVYAMIAAGYDPNAFASFFDRLVETKGKTGNWFTDIFGKPKPEEKRLREMVRITEQLPASCRDRRGAAVSDDFLKWQADVVSYRDIGRKEQLAGLLWKRELSPKLRSDITHFAFSSDGKYFLTQDDFAISVVQREPLKLLFQIPVSDAHEAAFSPDGNHVVFGTENLRLEKWSIVERKPVQVRELVVRRDCWEHGFSPDGNYLACFDFGLNLNVIDTRTGKRVWEKKEFYRLTFFEFLSWITAEAGNEQTRRARFFHIQFSPDSRVMLISRTNRFRFVFRVDSMVVDESENTTLALDLNTMKPISTGGDLKKMTQRAFVFLDARRILGMGLRKLDESGIFSFPEGKRLARFELGGLELKPTSNPNYVIVKPLANASMGVFDVSKAAIVGAWNKADTNIWENLILFESVSGVVSVSSLEYDSQEKVLTHKSLGTIDIPVAAIGSLHAAEVSDNFQWLAVSSKTRGAIWDLGSGARKMYVRGFRGALLANSGTGVGDFPKLEPVKHSLAVLQPASNVVQPFQELPDKGARQYGRFLLTRQSLKAPKKDDKAKADKEQSDADSDHEPSLGREVRFELRNLITAQSVWTREFPKEAPRFFFDEFSGRLILYWTLGSDAGKARLKEDAQLTARAKELGNKDDDYLMEIIDAFAGKTVAALPIETGKGSFDIESGFSEGNWLILRDTNNRILAYSMKDGDLRHRFFGATAAVNPGRNQIAVENHVGEVTLYDLETGNSQAKLDFGKGVAFLRFTLDGRQLFVLSKDQTAYALDVDKSSAQSLAP